MKIIMGILLLMTLSGRAQEHEIEQLLLNVEKLAQFKQILSDMQQGYEILSQGYNTIKDISEGNFNMHEFFIDGLLKVSPAVQKYYKVKKLIGLQKDLLDESKRIRQMLANDDWYQPGEMDHARHLSARAVAQTADHLLLLTDILTSSRFRMSDAERLDAIDRLYVRMDTRVANLRRYGSQLRVLALQRAKDLKDVNGIRELYGIE